MSETEQVRAEIEDIRARSDDLADVFDGVSEGVPMVGNVGKTRSENEVFIPDTLHCTVLVKTTDATYMGRTFKRIYRLGVNSAEAPLKKREALEFSDCSPDNPVPGHIVDSIGPVAQPTFSYIVLVCYCLLYSATMVRNTAFCLFHIGCDWRVCPTFVQIICVQICPNLVAYNQLLKE